ncbi:MAG TPA: hypothetical protein VFP20_05935 [Bacteroidales bacterium]|nr:hypothetical protein [Bacteroidales bacterium]
MNYLEFKRQLFDTGCFNVNQVYALQPNFDRNNFLHWIKRGLLIRLRQGFYTFPEYLGKPDFNFYFANRIYKPSYVSLHTALNFYGMIPEAVVQITSVTSLKTTNFTNPFGSFSYKNVREELMFGYDAKSIADGRSIQLAKPEKALLDLLYLFTFYNSVDDMKDLRLDEAFMQDDFDWDLMQDYSARIKSKVLEKRVILLINTYK